MKSVIRLCELDKQVDVLVCVSDREDLDARSTILRHRSSLFFLQPKKAVLPPAIIDDECLEILIFLSTRLGISDSLQVDLDTSPSDQRAHKSRTSLLRSSTSIADLLERCCHSHAHVTDLAVVFLGAIRNQAASHDTVHAGVNTLMPSSLAIETYQVPDGRA